MIFGGYGTALASLHLEASKGPGGTIYAGYELVEVLEFYFAELSKTNSTT